MVEGDLAEVLVQVVADAMGGVAAAGVDDVVTNFFGPVTSKNVYRASSFGSKVNTEKLFQARHFK
jgi:ABC-type Co2+ transport system permease subunit